MAFVQAHFSSAHSSRRLAGGGCQDCRTQIPQTSEPARRLPPSPLRRLIQLNLYEYLCQPKEKIPIIRRKMKGNKTRRVILRTFSVGEPPSSINLDAIPGRNGVIFKYPFSDHTSIKIFTRFRTFRPKRLIFIPICKL